MGCALIRLLRVVHGGRNVFGGKEKKFLYRAF
jgi:hypothetical protein